MTTRRPPMCITVAPETAAALRALAATRGVGVGRVVDSLVAEGRPAPRDAPAGRLAAASAFARDRAAPYLETLPPGRLEPCEAMLAWAHSDWGDWDVTQPKFDRALAELGYVVGLRGMVQHPPAADPVAPIGPLAAFVATLDLETFRARDVFPAFAAEHPGVPITVFGRHLRAAPGLTAHRDRTGVMIYRRAP